MRRVGVDTNVVVSFVTDRDPERQARAAELFGAATSAEHVVVVHQTVIIETVYVLCNLYGAEPKVVSAVMDDLLALPGVVAADEVEWPGIWTLWPRHVRDFGDACLTAVASAGAFDALATFDTAFAQRTRRRRIASYW